MKKRHRSSVVNDRADGSAVVELRQVSLTYPGPPQVQALRACDLRIERGDYLAITGASGSGKSTLLNVIGLLDRPTTGTYLFEGIDVSTLGERDRTALRGRQIGFVFQAFHLLPHRTALDNVSLAQTYVGVPRKQRRELAAAMLRRVGLATRIDAYAAQLSGGERQRVAISRALVNNPSLLLCDEPTGNLDSTTAATVLSLLDELHAGGQTIAIITHDHSVAARAGKSVQMNDGLLRPAAGEPTPLPATLAVRRS